MIPAYGPSPARILIVGEAPGEHEEQQGRPFVGPSGFELTRQLGDVGIMRADARITNVCQIRPPRNDINAFFAKSKKAITSEHQLIRDRWVLRPIVNGIANLTREIQECQPDVIIAFGNTALWALTGEWGILKWRGSYLHESLTARSVPVIPTLHPAAIVREWYLRGAAIRDLRRVRPILQSGDPPEPVRRFITRPSYRQVIDTLESLLLRPDDKRGTLSVDIETRRGHIACIGIAWSYHDAICIPLLSGPGLNSYWSLDEESEIHLRLRSLLTRDPVIGQNLLYDCQYFAKWLGYLPRVTFDTMIGQHALFSSMPKSLAFLASMYCEWYRYWKDEGKDAGGGNEDQWWHYNCLDCVYTLEVHDVLQTLTKQMQRESVQASQQALFHPVLRAMLYGVRVDTARRNALHDEIKGEIEKRQSYLEEVCGFRVNPRSPKQLMAFFYDDLKLPKQITRAKKGIPGRPTLNDEALTELGKIEPLVLPIVRAIADIRTLGIFLSSFIEAPLDADNRMRSSYNIGGSTRGKSAPKTYRLSSSESAFGSGTNLQTIPSDKSKSVNKAAKRGGDNAYRLPNLREMFVPDPGYTFWNGDLDRADLQVVAWEIDDEQLKAALRMGADIHLLNAFVLDGKEPPPLEELVEGHPRYADHRGPRKGTREFAKTFCHGTNYVGSARTMAAHTGRLVREIERAQAIWFGAHPGLRRWHRDVGEQVAKRRYVENKFGYRWYIFDRTDAILPEAVAWIPQSTVSNYINLIWQRIYSSAPDVKVLLQVHDSLGGQFPKDKKDDSMRRIADAARVSVPYPEPLVIPFSIRCSEVSWGEC